MTDILELEIATNILDILPNPVMVKNDDLKYVFINSSFEQLFNVSRSNVIGKLDSELFPNRQVAQCNGGDLRVLDTGEIDESVESVIDRNGSTRETITRKSRLTTGGNTYLVGVMHDITDVTHANTALKESELKLKEQAQQLDILASTDSLTGCANRRALVSNASQILNNQFTPAALLLIDIDNFKNINDTYGHDTGDATLCHFTSEVKDYVGPKDQFARIGGEEFVLLIDGADASTAQKRAEEIRQHIEYTACSVMDTQLKYTASIGISVKNKGDTAALDKMLSEADEQLYLAKTHGRNRVEIAA